MGLGLKDIGRHKKFTTKTAVAEPAEIARTPLRPWESDDPFKVTRTQTYEANRAVQDAQKRIARGPFLRAADENCPYHIDEALQGVQRPLTPIHPLAEPEHAGSIWALLRLICNLLRR